MEWGAIILLGGLVFYTIWEINRQVKIANTMPFIICMHAYKRCRDIIPKDLGIDIEKFFTYANIRLIYSYSANLLIVEGTKINSHLLLFDNTYLDDDIIYDREIPNKKGLDITFVVKRVIIDKDGHNIKNENGFVVRTEGIRPVLIGEIVIDRSLNSDFQPITLFEFPEYLFNKRVQDMYNIPISETVFKETLLKYNLKYDDIYGYISTNFIFTVA